jgi:hypothetical protein
MSHFHEFRASFVRILYPQRCLRRHGRDIGTMDGTVVPPHQIVRSLVATNNQCPLHRDAVLRTSDSQCIKHNGVECAVPTCVGGTTKVPSRPGRRARHLKECNNPARPPGWNLPTRHLFTWTYVNHQLASILGECAQTLFLADVNWSLTGPKIGARLAAAYLYHTHLGVGIFPWPRRN